MGRDPVRPAAAERVLAKWATTPPGVGMKAEDAAAVEAKRASVNPIEAQEQGRHCGVPHGEHG